MCRSCPRLWSGDQAGVLKVSAVILMCAANLRAMGPDAHYNLFHPTLYKGKKGFVILTSFHKRGKNQAKHKGQGCVLRAHHQL